MLVAVHHGEGKLLRLAREGEHPGEVDLRARANIPPGQHTTLFMDDDGLEETLHTDADATRTQTSTSSSLAAQAEKRALMAPAAEVAHALRVTNQLATGERNFT